MPTGVVFAPFPYNSIVLEGVPPVPEIFTRILEGQEDMRHFEYGYCATDPSQGVDPVRFLLFFQRKPYAAGKFISSGEIQPTSLREFFVALAQNPRLTLTFYSADPVLLKSILVVLECRPETVGSAEFLRLEEHVIELMEGRKDALVALVQDNHFHFAFAKGGKVVKVYFHDQVVQSATGLDWLELVRRISSYQTRGQKVRVRIYENMETFPAPDYLEGEPRYSGGVFRHYTRPMPELIVRDKTRTLKRVTVDQMPFVIGRNDDCSLTLIDPGVSRRHASLEESEGRFVVKDMGSTNGLFVNGHYTKEFALQDGDRITLGSHTLQVVLPRSPAEDVRLVSPSSGDATMAMDRNARIHVACPKCGAAGSLEATRLYRSKNTRIRCPKCRHLFEPLRGKGEPT